MDGRTLATSSALGRKRAFRAQMVVMAIEAEFAAHNMKLKRTEQPVNQIADAIWPQNVFAA